MLNPSINIHGPLVASFAALDSRGVRSGVVNIREPGYGYGDLMIYVPTLEAAEAIASAINAAFPAAKAEAA